MDSRWTDGALDPPGDDAAARLAECVHGSRLLGSDPALVLHGGGNTSVKATITDVTDAPVEVLYVKGSGHDLATIGPQGFAALRLARLRELLTVERLSDAQMVNELRCALIDASAPDPSIESLLHAMLPFAAVQHSHADVIVTLTNLTDGAERIAEVFGDSVVVIPYTMPGFDLTQACTREWPRQAHEGTLGMVLMNHGLFTFGSTTREAYERHVGLISRAEDYLARAVPPAARATAPLPPVAREDLVALRRRLSDAAGFPLVVRRHASPSVAEFVSRVDLAPVSTRGPATPDHIIRTKLRPLVGTDVDAYTSWYRGYFERNRTRSEASLTMLDPAPRVVLDPVIGMLTTGRSAKDASIVADIYEHTMGIITAGEALGGYAALDEGPLFDVEYWELEQAKLRRAGAPRPFAGEVVLVTGAASGIGKACADAFLAAGASVVGIDQADSVVEAFSSPEWLGLVTDVTDGTAVGKALDRAVEHFGGIDVVIACAGTFGASQTIAQLDLDAWRQTMKLNVDSVAELFHVCAPLLALAPRGGRVVVVASKNVPAPGAGAGAYSASKAALTQLARVAALEWAEHGVRVNTVHPDAVFDTGLWTEQLLGERAAKYGMTVEQYKRRNLLHMEINSATVAAGILRLCSNDFAATTGAQIAIDGGSDRII